MLVDVAKRGDNSSEDEAETVRRDCERRMELARAMVARAKEMRLQIEAMRRRLEQGQIRT